MRDPLLRLANVALKSVWTVSDTLRRPARPPEPPVPLSLTVAAREVVARDQNVVAFTLLRTDGTPLPRWHPGAHLDIHLPSGRIRQYSLCGDPGDRTRYRIAVRRIPDGGGGSIEMHDALPVGATVTSGGPRNAFPLVMPGYGSPTTRLRFIAGGIGITPILPMLALAERLGADWSMIYVGRTADSIPFRDEVRRFGGHIEIRTDDIHGIPSGVDLLGECPDGTTVYACGPAPMLSVIRDRLSGRDGVELHFERFAAPPVVDGEEFEATVASTGERISVAADESLLAALHKAGVGIPYSCQQGFCGTCRTRILRTTSGTVQHRDTLLTPPEHDGGVMLPCVSRATRGTDLLLDL